MTDQLRSDLLDRIAGSDSLDAVEAVRVAALGKAGSVTALLKTLGGMSPDERQAAGPRIHALREAVTAAIATRKAALEAAALDARLAGERLDMTLPVDLPPARQRPSGRAGDGRARRDLRRPGLRGRDGSGDRGRLA